MRIIVGSTALNYYGFSHKSHYGTEWFGDEGDLSEVIPKQVTTTIYEQV